MVDQEEQRLLNSEAILRNLLAEFKRQGIKVRKIDEDTFSYKGVHFDLQDAPTDTLNGIVYLIAPSKQTIPVREENLAETVKMIVDYVENQHEMENVSKGAFAKKSRMLSKSTLQSTADRIAMDCQCDSAEIHNLNGEYILMMPVLDSDCEYYYDEYDIYQEEMDGITYNCVNLSQLVKGVWKMKKSAKLSKNDKISPMGVWNKNETKGLDADQIRQPIRDWYTSAYPDDDLGMYLSDITFHDLHTGISQGLDVYDHIGVGDSVVRERLFDRLAELKSTSYDAIYDMWLGARKSMRKSSIVNVRSASYSNFTLNGEIVDVFLTDDGVYMGLSSNYDNQGHYDNSDGSL